MEEKEINASKNKTAPVAEKSEKKDAYNLLPHQAAALAYLLGPLSGIFFLLNEKNEQVRFHALQSIFFSLAVIFLMPLLYLFFPAFFYPFIQLGITGLWLFLMYQAYEGRQYQLPFIGPLAAQQLKKMKKAPSPEKEG